MKWFKVLIAFAALSIIVVSAAFLFVSCGKGNNSGRTEITLSFWQFWTDPDAKAVIEELVAEFEKINPKTKIVITDLTWGEGHSKIVVGFSGGNPPDIVELGSDWVNEFSSRGALADITVYVRDLIPERIMWEPTRLDDSYYAVPWFLDTRAIFYNKDLFVKAKLDPNSVPDNWDDFLSACKAINKLGRPVAGFGANSYEKHRLYKKFLPFVWSNGGEVIDNFAKADFNSERNREAFRYYLKLVKAGIIDNQQNLDGKFIDGNLGFDFSGGWLLKNIERNNPKLNYGVMAVPSPSGEIGTSFAGGEYLSISSACAHPKEAMEFIKFITDVPNAVKLCKAVGFGFPSGGNLPTDPFYSRNVNRKIFYEQLLHSRMSPNNPKWVYIEEIIEKMVEKGMYGKGTPKELLSQANDNIKQILIGDIN